MRYRPHVLGFCVLLISASALSAERVPPKPVSMVSPIYPESLVDTDKAGTARIEILVGADGQVEEATVKSADDPAFGVSAQAAVRQWVFAPGMKDGQPTAMRVTVPFQFKPTVEQQLNKMLGRKVFTTLPETPVAVKEMGEAPKPVKRGPPPYPKSKVGSGESPVVRVGFVISPEGKTMNPEILGKVDNDFILPAIITVSRMEFEKQKLKGKPVYVQMTTQVRFSEKPPEPRRQGGGGGGGGGGDRGGDGP